MMLISAMYINQTIDISIQWYLSWLAYVKYGGSSGAMAFLYQTEDTPLTVLYLIGVQSLLMTIRLGIADSIMVFLLMTSTAYPAIVANH
jgi:hypothetical protein